jgi:hypothetical protein
VFGGHLEFLRHFEVLFLKIRVFFFYGVQSTLPKYVIRSTINLIAHEMTIALPLKYFFYIKDMMVPIFFERQALSHLGSGDSKNKN